MNQWSEKNKFWAETCRTIILAVLGAVAAYFIIDPIKAETYEKSELDKKSLN